MVQRLPDPGMVPSSQEAGGAVHDNRLSMSAPGSQPGYDGGLMTYPVSTDAPLPPTPAGIPVSNEKARAPVVPGSSAGRGTFAQASSEDAGNADLWKLTPSAS